MEEREKGTSLTITDGGLPDLEGAKSLLGKFRDIKREILSEKEFYEIQAEGGRKELLNRRGCSILSLIFQLSEPEPPQVTVTELSEGVMLFRVRTCIQAPNGRRAWGVGSCSTAEIKGKGPRAYHDAESKAHTRAKERAVSDLVGGGEITAEEAGRTANGDGSSSGQQEGLHILAGKLDWEREQLMNFLSGQLGREITSTKDLTHREANQMQIELARQAKLAEQAA